MGLKRKRLFLIRFYVRILAVAEQGVGGSNFELQMYFYYANRGAHVYLAPGGNTPCSASAFLTNILENRFLMYTIFDGFCHNIHK